MLDRRRVFEIHQLKSQGDSVRSIAKKLGINRETVAKYLENPEKVMVKRRVPDEAASQLAGMLPL